MSTTHPDDPFDLARFVAAQRPVYDRVVAELAAGRKTSHWMWFVFPQVAGLGRSATAAHYAIGSLGEARAYLAHPVLGPRLMECARLVGSHPGRSAHAMFGSPDDLKLRSSMTLFAAAADDPAPFRGVLEQLFDGVPDPRTLELLARPG